MRIKKKSLCILLGCLSCATIQNPTGGPKDIDPPKLLWTEPKNETIAFNSKKIILHFDEPVDLSSPDSEILVTPSPQKPFMFRAKKNDITVLIDQELSKDLTYTINFGKAIVDVTEANAASNINYVFATGNKIDTIKVSGKVYYPFDNKRHQNVLVGIYALNSDLIQDRALWHTYTDDNGNFFFTNIKEGEYKLFAFSDEQKTKQFAYNKLLAFLPNNLLLNKDIEGVYLRLSEQECEEIDVLESKLDNELIKIQLATRIHPQDLEYKSGSDKIKLYLLTDQGPTDTLIFASSTLDFNTLDIFLTNRLNSKTFKIQIKNSNSINPKNIDISSNVNNKVLSDKNLVLKLNKPILTLDTNKIQLLYQDQIVSDVNFSKGKTIGNDVCVEYIISTEWVNSDNSYKIIVPSQTFKSIYGGENLSFEQDFNVKNDPKYFGSITLHLIVKNADKILVRLYQNKEFLQEQRYITGKPLVFNRLIPGAYDIFFIKDENQNGRFDQVSLSKKTQPEPVVQYPTQIVVKANWAYEESFTLNFD